MQAKNLTVLSSIETGFSNLKQMYVDFNKTDYKNAHDKIDIAITKINKPLSEFDEQDFVKVYNDILNEPGIKSPIEYRDDIVAAVQKIAIATGNDFEAISKNNIYTNSYRSNDWKVSPAVWNFEYKENQTKNTKITTEQILSIYQDALIYILKAEIAQYIIARGAPTNEYAQPTDLTNSINNLNLAAQKAVGNHMPGYIYVADIQNKNEYTIAPLFPKTGHIYLDESGNVPLNSQDVEYLKDKKRFPLNFEQYSWDTLDANVLSMVDAIQFDESIHKELFNEISYGASGKTSIFDLLKQLGLFSSFVDERAQLKGADYKITGLNSGGIFNHRFTLLTNPAESTESGFDVLNKFVPVVQPTHTGQRIEHGSDYISTECLHTLHKVAELCYECNENYLGVKRQCLGYQKCLNYNRSGKCTKYGDWVEGGPLANAFRNIVDQRGTYAGPNPLYGFEHKRSYTTNNPLVFYLYPNWPVLMDPYGTTLVSFPIKPYYGMNSFYNVTTIVNGISNIEYCDAKYKNHKFVGVEFDREHQDEDQPKDRYIEITCQYEGGDHYSQHGLPLLHDIPDTRDTAPSQWNVVLEGDKKDKMITGNCLNHDVTACPIIHPIEQLKRQKQKE